MQPDNFLANTIEYLERRKALAALAGNPLADQLGAAIELLRSPVQSGLGDK